LILPTLFRRGLPAYKNFIWFLRASQNDEQLTIEKSNPSIDLVWIAERKDFETLILSIRSAIRHSLNPINSIKVIVPETQITECQELINMQYYKFEVKIISEFKVIPPVLIDKIKCKFPEKFGWILQQFLKLESVQNSKSAGVLIIDADTILLEDRLWLDQNLNQILMTAPWQHEPYFSFLRKLGLFTGKSRYSFVTHHMLMQPKVLQEVITNKGFNNMRSFIEFLLEEVNDSNIKGFCVDYELYGNYFYAKFPDKTRLIRFCNLSKKSDLDSLSLKKLIEQLEDFGEFRSISLHSWNSG
jgi:uncharacterized protein Usg